MKDKGQAQGRMTDDGQWMTDDRQVVAQGLLSRAGTRSAPTVAPPAPATLSVSPSVPESDQVERAYFGLLLAAGIIGWGGVALAEVGAFRAPVLVPLLMAALGAAALSVRRLRASGFAGKPVDWVPVALVLLCLPLYFRPHEFILGGADAGVYVNTGVNLARTGALLIYDPAVAQVGEDVWPSLFRPDPGGVVARYIRFPGYYLSDDQPGWVIPQFFPLQVVWIGLAALAGGLWAALYATPVWAMVGVLGVYYTGRGLFGRPAGALAALLLAITPTQVWFARYPTAEALTQALLWGGFYAWVRFTEREDAPSVFGLLAGLLFGLTFLARIDLPYLALLPAGWLLYRLVTRQARRRDLAFLVPFGLLAVHGLAHALIFARPYTLNTYSGIAFLARELGPAVGAVGVIGLVGGMAVYGVATRRRSGQSRNGFSPEDIGEALRALADRFQFPIRLGWVIGLIGLAVYGYFIRPRLGAVKLVPYAYGATQVPISDHENMVRLGWYLTPLGIWLGVAGLALIAWRERWRRLWLPLGLALLATLLYLYRMLNNPHHIYTMRRYVPLVIPLFMLGAAYVLVWLGDRRKTGGRVGAHGRAPLPSVLHPLSSVLLGLALILGLGYQGRVVLTHVEYAGLIGQVSDLAAAVGPGSVVVFDDPAPVGSGALLGTPLEYLFGLTVFDLQVGWSRAGLEHVVRWGLGAGRPVVLLARPGGGATDALAQAGLQLTWQRRVTVDVPTLEQPYDHFPTAINRFALSLDLYQVTDRSDD